MRYLYLLRHATADSPRGIDDFDRSLNRIGQQEAVSMGQHLSKKAIRFDCVFSSSAMRALTTAQLVAANLSQAQLKIVKNADLYQANEIELLHIIHDLSNDAEHVMIVGHNPTMTNIANRFTGDNISMSPSSVYAIEFNVDDWGAVSFGSGTCLFFDYPGK